MITYHPFGTRGYKNLQIWDHEKQLKIIETHLGQVLMNDQEPIYLDSMKSWKTEQREIVNQSPFQQVSTPSYQIGLMNAHKLDYKQITNSTLLGMLSDRNHKQYLTRASTIKDPVALSLIQI